VQKKIFLQGASYYAAGSANLCESYSLADLSSLNNYVVQFSVEHQTGQPLKFSIIDEASQRLLLDQRLGESETEQYFFIPRLRLWRNQQHNLFFYLSAQSYGQPSANAVTEIRLIQYPIEYLSQIKLEPVGAARAAALPALPPLGQKYALAQTQKTNASHYQAQLAVVASAAKQAPALVLARSFDQNWLARAQTTTGQWQSLPHTRFNSWANAWLLPSAVAETQNALQEIQVSYWPQQLVVWGLRLFGLELLVIGGVSFCHTNGYCRHIFGLERTTPKRYFH
jgi:hypothetical protein